MSLYVFNQYYFDLLKKVKDYSKSNQEKSQAHSIRTAIKTHYSSYDKTAAEYRDFFVKNTETAMSDWENSRFQDLKSAKTWLMQTNGQSQIYEDITLLDVDASIRSKKTFFYYFTLLCIFVKDMTEEEVSKVVGLLKNIKNTEEYEASLETIDDELLKHHLTFLLYLQKQSLVNTSSEQNPETVQEGISDTMQQLETTSLGKLAKEIMGDIDINEVHNSLNGGKNILDSLTNPDGGLSKLLGTVSQKMISKMASGEIKQETLLQDALKFSSQLQNMIPKDSSGMGGMGGFGDIASMMSKVGDLANMMGKSGKKDESGSGSDDNSDDEGGFSFSKMANMIGKFNSSDGKKKQSRPVINKPEINRVSRAKELRKKLERRKREKQSEVVDIDEVKQIKN